MEWVQSVFLGVFLKFSINIFLDIFSSLLNFEKRDILFAALI